MATALPEKRIKKIKLPGDVSGDKTYEIIPDKMQSSGFQAVLPTLTSDTTIITADGALKNPNALRFFVNTDTTRFVSYDGSSQVDLTFKPSLTAGAFEITDGTTTKTIQLVGTFTDNNYYATSDFNSSNGTKIATGYSSGSASATYDLYVPNATANQSGIVTTGAQTFAGNKTFANPIYIQSSGQYPTNMGYLGGDSTNGLHLCASGPNLTLDTVGASIFIGTNTAGGQLKVSDASNVTTSGFTFTDKYKATSSSTVYTSTYTFPTKQADGSYTIATTDDVTQILRFI